MAVDWKEYQEEAAEFFRSIGFAASTNVTVKGVRTEHDIDVYVTINVAGFDVKWLAECKHWKTPVNKLHILALREIVADVGADRGIILCEVGFQSGAFEAANLTNVQVTSLAALALSSSDAVYAVRLHELFDRTEACRERYWDIPKDIRIEKGLRYDIGDGHTYSGARVVEIASELLSLAFRGIYPIVVDPLHRFSNPEIPESLVSHEDVVSVLDSLLTELEGKLDEVSS